MFKSCFFPDLVSLSLPFFVDNWSGVVRFFSLDSLFLSTSYTFNFVVVFRVHEYSGSIFSRRLYTCVSVCVPVIFDYVLSFKFVWNRVGTDDSIDSNDSATKWVRAHMDIDSGIKANHCWFSRIVFSWQYQLSKTNPKHKRKLYT